MYDLLIVGAGLYGATFARLAADSGKSVLVIERRDHVAGNAYTEEVNGIQVHRYGAHIFHTDDEAVWNFVNRFAVFNRFTNAPVANYKGEIYPLPFNMHTFNRMWGVAKPEEAAAIIDAQRTEVTGEPHNLEEQAIALVCRDIYEKLVKGYTEKQWGRSCKELPAFIIRRLPVRYTYDNNYFNSRFQGIPKAGYTKMTENMLDGIEVRLGVDYLDDKAFWDAQAKTVVYSGPIDRYFGYCLGPLQYRSVRFEIETLDTPNYQGVAVMNFTDRETPWTRIIEHKHFVFGQQPKTVISREYSDEWTPGAEPFYPVNDEKNNSIYRRYAKMAQKETNVVFGGRLAGFQYIDMDQTIAKAIKDFNLLFRVPPFTPHDGCAVIPTALGRDKPGR